MIKQNPITKQKQLIKLKAEQFSKNDLKRIQKIQFKQIPVIGLTDTNQKYINLVNAIKLYNKNNQIGVKTQPYQYQTYQKLAQILKQLKYQAIETKKIVLQKTLQWFTNQQKKIKYQKQDKQRFRHKNISRNIVNSTALNLQKKPNLQLMGVNIAQFNTPSQQIKQQLQPFRNKNRSAYLQIKPPLQRLKQYQRKQILMTNRTVKSQLSKKIEESQKKMSHRVSYQQNNNYKVNDSLFSPQTIASSSVKQGQSILDTKQINTQITSIQFKSIDDNTKVQQIPKNQIINQVKNQTYFDGPVQQQEQEDDKEEQIPIKDKLAPHTKPYRSAMKIEQQRQKKNFINSQKKHKQELNMEKLYYKSLNKKNSSIKQDQQLRQKLQDWARIKARQQKQRKRKLESKLTMFTSRIEKQPRLQQKNLSLQDEIKYNIHKVTPVKKDTLNISFELPKILPTNKFVNGLLQFQKSILKNQTLQNRKKFKRNLSIDNEQSDNNSADFGYSIPPFTQIIRQKQLSFAQILSQHSIQKQKQKQIQQVYQIKDRLAKHNFNSIDINTIAKGLILPQVQQNELAQLPQKQLLHNKFFVVPTKKKRKKKKK